MVGSETRPVRKGRLRFVRLAQRGMGSGGSGPRLDPLRIEGGHLLERLEGLSWAGVIQEDFAFREPWFRIIPSKGDGAVVVLDGRTPSAFPLEERAFSEEVVCVMRILPELSR